MSSAAFFAIVSSIFSPPPSTGWAAPMCVPGAIAATSAAIVRMKPAEAARAPDGRDEDRDRRPGRDHARDDRRAWNRRSPPGVRSVNTTSAAPARSARSSVSIMYSAETGWMMLSTTAEYTMGGNPEGTGDRRDCALVSARISVRQAANRRAQRAVMVVRAQIDYRPSPYRAAPVRPPPYRRADDRDRPPRLRRMCQHRSGGCCGNRFQHVVARPGTSCCWRVVTALEGTSGVSTSISTDISSPSTKGTVLPSRPYPVYTRCSSRSVCFHQTSRSATSAAKTGWLSPRFPHQKKKANQRAFCLVRKRGLEPPRYCYRQPLKLVRLPIPPLPR